MMMALIDFVISVFDVAQTRINLHPDKSLRQLSSSRLANKRIHAYGSVIAMCMVHPALLMLSFFVVLRFRSKYSSFYLHTAKDSSTRTFISPQHLKANSAAKEIHKLTLAICIVNNAVVVVCVFEPTAFHLIIIRQCLLMSGDVELNPGPLDGEYYIILVLYLV